MTPDQDHEGWPARAHEAFVDALWSLLVDEDGYTAGQPSWIESRFRGVPPGAAPTDPTAAALRRILDRGADPDDLTDLVRAMQHEVLYNVCQLIDDPGLLGLDPEDGDSSADGSADGPGAPEPGWELLAVRTAGPAGRASIGELHSSLDSRDPSGRGGEPRGRPLPAALPGLAPYARLAVAHALAGDRVLALKTWRQATGAPLGEAKAAIDHLLDQLRGGPQGTA